MIKRGNFMKKKLRVACLLGALFLMFVMWQLSFGAYYCEDYVRIYARWVNGFGSNHGWHDVDKAEGFLGEIREWENGDFAWKYLGTEYYGRLLKAYDFERWAPEKPIDSVLAWVGVEGYCSECDDDLLVQIRVYDGTNVILSYTDSIGVDHWPNIADVYVEIPPPPGGWTKDEIDKLQIWVGAKEQKDIDFRVYYFSFYVAY
jgi:hypothetical protein